MQSTIRICVFLASLGLAAHSGSTPPPPIEPFIEQGKRIDKAQAADIATAKLGGKVLRVDEEKQGELTVYRVKLLLKLEGKVKIIYIDGSNGEIM